MSEIKAIYSSRCWLENSLQPATVFIENGIINRIVKGLADTEGLLHAGNDVLMPGCIDAHVHINEPGRTEWEGFDTGLQAAAAGGITTIIEMPLNASPVTTTADALAQKIKSLEGKLHINCGLYGGIIPGNTNDIESLINGGVWGMKAFLTHSGIDEFPNATKEDLKLAMPLLAKRNIPLLVHCELTDNNHNDALSLSPTSYKAYLQSRPKEWEDDAVEMMIGLCREFTCHVHIVHVSSANALQMITKAKKEGLRITAETCPHYLFFNAEEIPDGNTLYKCAPPIREAKNNEQLKIALLDETLDFIASDHSPAPPEIKEIETGNLQKAWGGIAGLQFLLSAGWSSLRDYLSLEKFIPLVTENPARFLQLDTSKGFIKVGHDADLVVWNPEETFLVNEQDILHRHKGTPYLGKHLYGQIKQTFVLGHLVFDNNHILQKNKGRCLLK